MKIILPCIGSSCEEKIVQKWLDCYIESGTEIPCYMYYDSNTQKNIFDIWGDRPKIKTTLNISLKMDMPLIYDLSLIMNFLYLDTVKFYAYRDCGDCIVIDYDAFIKRKINVLDIPACHYGVSNHHRYSNHFLKNKYILQDLIWVDEFDYLQWINCGVQIFRKDCFDVYMNLMKKYLPYIYQDICPECFGQTIISIAVRELNGIYLSEDWNWYWDSSVQNNNAYIHHYYGKNSKKELLK